MRTFKLLNNVCVIYDSTVLNVQQNRYIYPSLIPGVQFQLLLFLDRGETVSDSWF